VLGNEDARGRVFEQLYYLLGEQGAKVTQEIVKNASAKPATGLVASITGIVTLLFGASGVFGQLQASLNMIWEVERKAGQGFLKLIKDRFLSFGFILIVGFLLLVSLMLSSAISFVSQWLGGHAPGLEVIAHVLNFTLSFAAITALFAFMFKLLPDAVIAWKDVWVGAAVTSILFSIGKLALGIYLGKSSVGSAYGAAGSLIVLLLWVYYTAQIFFFGAELTKVWANRFGSRVVPAEGAEYTGKEKGKHPPNEPDR